MPRLGLGLGLSKVANKPIVQGGLSPEALAWEANIIANGGTIPADTLAIIDENLITPAVAAGIWAELDRLHWWCGLNGYPIAARTNMIKAAHYATFVSSPVFDNNGVKSAGAGSYIDLNYNLSTQSVKLTQNSNCSGIITLNPAFSVTLRSDGANNGSGSRYEMQKSTGLLGVFASASSSTNNTNIVTSGKVLIASQRENSTEQKAIINTSVVTGTVSSVALPNLNKFELSLNFGGASLGPEDTEYHMTSFDGSSNFNLQTLDTYMKNTITALGL